MTLDMRARATRWLQEAIDMRKIWAEGDGVRSELGQMGCPGAPWEECEKRRQAAW